MNPLEYQSSGQRKYERTGVLRKLFGPSHKEIWYILAQSIGAEFDPGGWTRAARVSAEVGEWTVTLDTYTVSNGKTSTTFTRMRAPYVNRDGFRFVMYHETVFSGLGRMLGMQDITVGDAAFDAAFVVKSSNPHQARRFLADPDLRRRLIEQAKHVRLEVKDDEGWFTATFPEGVDELVFTTVGVIKDLDRLHALFELFAAALQRLCHIGSAYEDDPNVRL
jgi:hypothetical protein